MNNLDKEIEAIGAIVEIIRDLQPPSRARVITFFADAEIDEVADEADPPPPHGSCHEGGWLRAS